MVIPSDHQAVVYQSPVGQGSVTSDCAKSLSKICFLFLVTTVVSKQDLANVSETNKRANFGIMVCAVKNI